MEAGAPSTADNSDNANPILNPYENDMFNISNVSQTLDQNKLSKFKRRGSTIKKFNGYKLDDTKHADISILSNGIEAKINSENNTPSIINMKKSNSPYNVKKFDLEAYRGEENQ